MRRLSNILPVFLLIILVAACQHKSNIQPAPNSGTNNNPTNPNNPNNPANPPDTALCFERDILPIFKTNCAKSGCHDAASRQEGYVFTSWETITSRGFTPGSPGRTKLYEAITENDPGDIMPQPPAPPLTLSQKELIRRWIQDGGKNTTGCGVLCDSNNFSYAADIKPLVDKYCKGCHTATLAQKGIILDTYNGLQDATLNGRLLDAINHRAGVVAMPYNSAKLSDCEIRQFEKWAASGAPEN